MRDAFLKQLEELHKMLAEMGLLCEKMIDGTYEALMHMDREQAAKILQDDANVDLKERDIESKCLKLLLEQQPVASDLRKISSALKMITDLERIGDQAGDIHRPLRAGKGDKTWRDGKSRCVHGPREH